MWYSRASLEDITASQNNYNDGNNNTIRHGHAVGSCGAYRERIKVLEIRIFSNGPNITTNSLNTVHYLESKRSSHLGTSKTVMFSRLWVCLYILRVHNLCGYYYLYGLITSFIKIHTLSIKKKSRTYMWSLLFLLPILINSVILSALLFVEKQFFPKINILNKIVLFCWRVHIRNLILRFRDHWFF